MYFTKNIIGKCISNRLIIHRRDGLAFCFTNNIKDFNYIIDAVKRGYTHSKVVPKVTFTKFKMLNNLDPIFDAIIRVNDKVTRN